jgi:hypothetical protein
MSYFIDLTMMYSSTKTNTKKVGILEEKKVNIKLLLYLSFSVRLVLCIVNVRHSEISSYTDYHCSKDVSGYCIALNKGGGEDFRSAGFGTQLDSLTGECLHSLGEGS